MSPQSLSYGPLLLLVLRDISTFSMSPAHCLSVVGSHKHPAFAYCLVALESAWPVPHFAMRSVLWVLSLITDHLGSHCGLEGTSFLPSLRSSAVSTLLIATAVGLFGSALPGGDLVQKPLMHQAS